MMEEITVENLVAHGFAIEYCTETETYINNDGSEEVLCSIQRPVTATKDGVGLELLVSASPVETGKFYIDLLKKDETYFDSIEDFIYSSPSPSP